MLGLELDGQGRAKVRRSWGFSTTHGYFGLELEAKGDLYVYPHHTVEDVRICLSQALSQAAMMGDRTDIRRYGKRLGAHG